MLHKSPDVGTIFVLVAIIIMATAATVVLVRTISSTGESTQETNNSRLEATEKKIIVDEIYYIFDLNKSSETYDKVKAMWIKIRVPKYGSPVDLRKTTLVIEGKETTKRYAKYVDADGDNIFENDACETTNPFPATHPTSPGNVNYDTLTGDRYTAIWIKCNGKGEDYIIYPNQEVQIIYVIPEGLEKGEQIKITIDVPGGAKETLETKVPNTNISIFRTKLAVKSVNH